MGHRTLGSRAVKERLKDWAADKGPLRKVY